MRTNAEILAAAILDAVNAMPLDKTQNGYPLTVIDHIDAATRLVARALAAEHGPYWAGILATRLNRARRHA